MTPAVRAILDKYESDSPATKANLARILMQGKLGGTGKLIILPVDQGIEHSGGASFAPNPAYFDPENIVKLAIEGGCNAVASTLGVLGSVMLLGERPTPSDWLGLALVISASGSIMLPARKVAKATA